MKLSSVHLGSRYRKVPKVGKMGSRVSNDWKKSMMRSGYMKQFARCVSFSSLAALLFSCDVRAEGDASLNCAMLLVVLLAGAVPPSQFESVAKSVDEFAHTTVCAVVRFVRPRTNVRTKAASRMVRAFAYLGVGIGLELWSCYFMRNREEKSPIACKKCSTTRGAGTLIGM